MCLPSFGLANARNASSGLIDGVMGVYCDECALGRDLRIVETSSPPRTRSAPGGSAPLVPSRQPAVPDEARELTPIQQGLLDAAANIRERRPNPPDLAFMAKHLVQVTLPHRDPGEVPFWSRTNGDLTLVMARTQLDEETGQMVGYPYGTVPRLLLYWVTSEAVRTKSRKLELGHSLSEFMREVGLNPNNGTGKRSDSARLREQMSRLFASSISFQHTKNSGGRLGKQWLNMPVSRAGQLWWDPKDPAQGNLWQSWIELGEDFYNAITSGPVPVDTRALCALNNSPLALDLYGWATYKAYAVTAKGQAQFISYQDFMSQLGADYADRKNFKKKLLGVLKKVQVVYPQLKIEIVTGGLKIHPCRTAVPVLGVKTLNY